MLCIIYVMRYYGLERVLKCLCIIFQVRQAGFFHVLYVFSHILMYCGIQREKPIVICDSDSQADPMEL